MSLFSQPNQISIAKGEKGVKLIVDGQDFLIKGMNWDYIPIGTNYEYNLWGQSDEFIQAERFVLDYVQADGKKTIEEFTKRTEEMSNAVSKLRSKVSRKS